MVYYNFLISNCINVSVLNRLFFVGSLSSLPIRVSARTMCAALKLRKKVACVLRSTIQFLRRQLTHHPPWPAIVKHPTSSTSPRSLMTFSRLTAARTAFPVESLVRNHSVSFRLRCPPCNQHPSILTSLAHHLLTTRFDCAANHVVNSKYKKPS